MSSLLSLWQLDVPSSRIVQAFLQGIDVVLPIPVPGQLDGQVTGEISIVACLDSAAPASKLDALNVGGFGPRCLHQGKRALLQDFPKARSSISAAVHQDAMPSKVFLHC